jgi:hypothetical protein
MLLSAVSVLVVALPSSEIPEGLMIYPVYVGQEDHLKPKSPKMNTIRKCRNIQVKQQNTSGMNTIKCNGIRKKQYHWGTDEVSIYVNCRTEQNRQASLSLVHDWK